MMERCGYFEWLNCHCFGETPFQRLNARLKPLGFRKNQFGPAIFMKEPFDQTHLEH